MGFNSLMFAINDNLEEAKREPVEFVNEMVRSMGSGMTGPLMGRFSSFTIPHVGHANDAAVVLVGGNEASRIYRGPAIESMHRAGDASIKLLRKLATYHGYRLVRLSPKLER